MARATAATNVVRSTCMQHSKHTKYDERFSSNTLNTVIIVSVILICFFCNVQRKITCIQFRLAVMAKLQKQQ